MSYFEEKLPSNGNKAVCFRQYSVDDAIVVSSMNPKMKERITSKFLSVIQTGEDIINPSSQMTIEDRRTLLFKYALVSLEEKTLFEQEKFTLENCTFCGSSHAFFLSLEDFKKTAKNKIVTSTEIETEFANQRLLVTPLLGIHAEQLEMFENNLTRWKQTSGEDSDKFHTERIKRDLYKLLAQFTLVDESHQERTEKENAERDRKWLYSLPQKSFEGFCELIARKQAENKHGIDFTYSYTCPETEGHIASMLPFRFENFVPRI